MSAKDLPRGGTRIINSHQIRRLNRPFVETDENSAPENISDTEDWLNWNGDLDDPNDSKDDCEVDVESDIEQDNGIEDPECPEQRDGSAMPNVPGWIRPTGNSKRQAGMVLLTVNAIDKRGNMGAKKMSNRMSQCFTSFFMLLD